MRRVLIERSRARAAVKRGNASIRLSLDENVAAADVATVDLLALDISPATVKRELGHPAT
jgi:hypothetical protein